MFTSINIENYRGIRKASVPDLSRINLFYGKNNSGKSSLLEAVFLLTGQSNPLLPLQANKIRGINGVSVKTISYDFYRTDPNNFIRISAEGSIYRELTIQLIQSNSHNISLNDIPFGKSDSSEEYFGIKMLYKLNGNNLNYNSSLVISSKDIENAKISKDNRYVETLFAQYMPSVYSLDTTTSHLSNIFKNKREQSVLDVLRLIEPRVVDIQVVGNEILVDVGVDERLPINVLGDGIRKVLSIVVAVYESSNGMLIIDELDNGLHFSIMSDVWKAVLLAAKEYNVQLFVSSHSLDTIKGLVSAAGNDIESQSLISAYKLIRKDDDEVVALHYNYENLAYAVEQEMEVR